MKIAIRKRLDIIFSYGGQRRDLEEALDLIAAKILDPVVADGKLEDFPQILEKLEAGKIRGRTSLLFD
jgi:propanol-preferring alcohol dehydrogenase